MAPRVGWLTLVRVTIVNTVERDTDTVFQEGEVTRWCIENSWGEQMNANGYITMTTEWFKEYVFEVVVDKGLLPVHVLDVFNQEPKVLPIWHQLHSFSSVNWRGFPFEFITNSVDPPSNYVIFISFRRFVFCTPRIIYYII